MQRRAIFVTQREQEQKITDAMQIQAGQGFRERRSDASKDSQRGRETRCFLIHLSAAAFLKRHDCLGLDIDTFR